MAALARTARLSGRIFNKSKTLPCCSSQVRWLNLHEYQSKGLMRDFDINIQPFEVAGTAAEAANIAKTFKPDEYVIKAQILAGGRGKGTFLNGFKGGVHLTKDSSEMESLVGKMLGQRLVTKQTTKDGVEVSKVMVAKALDISRETYFAILMDRGSQGPVMVGSPKGGMDIEAVAEEDPGAIFKEVIDIKTGVKDEQAEGMAKNLGFEGDNIKIAADQMKKLYNMFLSVDATQIEINPLGETTQKDVVCFDAKINFDDNAEFRQKNIFSMGDSSEDDPREVQAKEYNLNYVGMDGNIGCLVNGAGLAMATMDIVKLYGGEPANFLDVGGGVQTSQVSQALKIITKDSRVKAILVNVFGGIVDCAVIANGVVNAVKEVGLAVPMTVRLEGTNVNEARKIVSEAALQGLNIYMASTFADAAQHAVSSIAK